MRSEGWIESRNIALFEKEKTNAYRVFSSAQSRVERYALDYLIQGYSEEEIRSLRDPLIAFLKKEGLPYHRLWGKTLTKNAKEKDKPSLILNLEKEVENEIEILENNIRYWVDFNAGYSHGFFLDQRHNRTFLKNTRPQSLLNCFSYTGSFSVVGALVGAETTSIDISPKAMAWAKKNFSLNELSTQGHHFIVDDVIAVLPRFIRRGLKFSAIILDPPTFSRGKSGRIFRVEKDMPHLIESAISLLEPQGCICVSSNSSLLTVSELKKMVSETFKSRPFQIKPPPPPHDLKLHPTSHSLWVLAG